MFVSPLQTRIQAQGAMGANRAVWQQQSETLLECAAGRKQPLLLILHHVARTCFIRY
jgi:hypothetical protein